MPLQTADFNHEVFSQSKENQRKQDETLFVKFEHRDKHDQAESKERGYPVFKQVEYIDIRVPGRLDSVVRPANEMDRARFPDHYKRFKDRTEQDVGMGMPLAEWARIPSSSIKTLEYFNIKTVEQLATVADSQLSQIRGAATMKRLAQEWLEHIKEEEPFREVKAENAELKTEMEEMKATVARLIDQIDGKSDEVKQHLTTAQKCAATKKANVEKKALQVKFKEESGLG